MDPLIDRRLRHPHLALATSGAAPDDVGRVLRETRQHFIDAFGSQCDSVDGMADHAAGASSEEAISVLHRMAGLGDGVGFPRVSVKAAQLEDALRASTLSAEAIRQGVAALRDAFAQDLADPVAAPPAMPQGPPMTVLLVEDEPFQRAIVCAQLRKAGHRPVEVATGEEVLAAALRVRPDVILLDVGLPGINGYDVCRLLKANPALAGIPVAFLSAHGQLDDRLTGLSHGADDFLTKPLDPRELALRLQLLGRRSPRANDSTARGVMTFEAFRDEAAEDLRRDRCALALIRTPADRAPEVAAFARLEIRRRDLCGQQDRSQVVVLLPDISPTAARDRVASIVETCRTKGISGVYAGIASSASANARLLDDLLEEADEALAVARFEGTAAAIRPAGPRLQPPAPSLKPMIIVADDDPDVVRVVDAHLAAEGYRRVLTFDGIRALEEVRAQTPAVLVLDLMMPRMTGFDVLAGLREMGESRPRVIVLSARGREEDVIRAFSLGADDFVAKPFNPQELLARIARLLN